MIRHDDRGVGCFGCRDNGSGRLETAGDDKAANAGFNRVELYPDPVARNDDKLVTWKPGYKLILLFVAMFRLVHEVPTQNSTDVASGSVDLAGVLALTGLGNEQGKQFLQREHADE